MSIFGVVGIAIIGVIMSLILKNYKSPLALIITLLTGVIILFWCICNIVPVVNKLTYFMSETRMPSEYSVIILKALGLTFITQFISDICKDAGETAIASKLELAGKISILVLSLPLFEKIISIVFEMLRY